MRQNEAKELFRVLTAKYFSKADVIFANQSRTAKPTIPLVTIKPGNIKRQAFSCDTIIGGEKTKHYLSRLSLQVDLFTNGMPVYDETGQIVAYEDSATEELTSFVDFLDSDYTLDWCHKNDVSISIEGEVQNLTGIVNDNNYEYRAKVVILFYYTQKTIGSASVFAEESIKYPVYETEKDIETGETVIKVDPETNEPIIKVDPETDEPIYTTEEPEPTVSITGSFIDIAEVQEKNSVIIPVVNETSSVGVNAELTKAEIGYFDKVKIEEEINNE